jgi:hypothetical protein
MPIFGNESNRVRPLENSRGDRKPTSQRPEQLAVAGAFYTGDPDDLPCTDDEACVPHAYSAGCIYERDTVCTEDRPRRSLFLQSVVG